ncbi:MAG TPA: tetratricopeptide repeat protein [Cyclobacteriaceae bacterium]|nr:tetratricopeptide repeat protein [Cyclobacteriaceae bacterium]
MRFAFTLCLLFGLVSGSYSQQAFIESWIKGKLLEFRSLPARPHSPQVQSLLDEAVRSIKNGRFSEGMKHLGQLLKVDSTVEETYFYRAVVAKNIRQYSWAVDNLRYIPREFEFNTLVEIESAKINLLDKRYRKAAAEFRNVFEQDSSIVLAPLMLGYIALNLNEFDSAGLYFDKCLHIKHDYVDAIILKGALEEVRRKDIRAGIPSYDNAVRLDSTFLPARILLANATMEDQPRLSIVQLDKIIAMGMEGARSIRGGLYVRLEDYELAWTDFRTLFTLSKLDDSKFMGFQTALDLALDYQYAVQYLTKHIYGLSENDRTILKKAFCLLVVRDYGKCLSALNELSNIEESAAGLYLRGLARDHSKEFEIAWKDFDQALKLDSSIVDAHKKRGVYRSNRGQLDASAEDFSAMLRLDPNAFVAYNLRGVVRYRQKEYQLAIEDFNRYMKYDSLDSRLYFNRGECYRLNNQHLLAGLDYVAIRRSIRDLDGDKILQDFDQLLIHGDTAKAEYYAALFVSSEKNFASGYKVLINIWKKQGKWDRIEKIIDVALKSAHDSYSWQPSYPYFLIIHGMILNRTGKSLEALADLDKAISLDTSTSLGFLERGKIYMSLKRDRESKRDLTKAAKMGNQEASKILKETFSK